jgi:hypothetical protein
VLVSQRNFKIALGDFVISFGKDRDIAHYTVVEDSIYIGIHFFSSQFLIMSMPIAMSAKLALHIAIVLAITPTHIMVFTVGCPLALRRFPD